MESKGRSLGGRSYLVSELGEHGASHRRAVAIVTRYLRKWVWHFVVASTWNFPSGTCTRTSV